jgi:hypothetical protein
MNTGKDLEDLVAQIEKQLIGENFTVSTRNKVFDDSGTQLAEFDVVIEGVLGSSNISWLIQCRDRPSAGPAPAEWIEQLVGRKDRFNFDKVIAVSTTGFSDPAVQFAGAKGILLRTVKDLDEISEDTSVKYLNLGLQDLIVKGTVDLKTVGKSPKSKTQASDPKFKMPNESEFLELKPFILKHIASTSPIFADGKHERTVVINQRFDALINGKKYKLKGLSVVVEIENKVIGGKALLFRKYETPEKLLGEEGIFNLSTPAGEVKVSVLSIFRENGKKDIHVALPDELLNKYGFTGAFGAKHQT